MTIGWGKPINKLVNAVGVETKIEIHDAPPTDVLDPGLPESLQNLSAEAKASLQKVDTAYLELVSVVAILNGYEPWIDGGGASRSALGPVACSCEWKRPAQ